MNNLYDLRKEVEYLKNKLQVLVSDDSYDKIISVCKGKNADEKLIDALALLEEAVVEFNNIKNKL